ncbi:MAG TPA: O-antigen ligase family protein [Gaiellaceae bacterium]|nr:O-antigen ligase family protein [Gaiellaceae bacterium]
MAVRSLNPALAERLGARRAAVVALALPALFLHAEFQPTVSFPLGSADVDVRLSDLAVLAVVAAAIVDGRRRGFGVLAAARWAWVALAALVAWVAAAVAYGPLVLDGYPVAENAVTAAKFAEYALLAPALALLVRDRDDLRPIAVALVLWSALATAVGLLQLAGLHLFDVSDPGRQRSFLGHHDFAALSGASLLLGLALLVLEDRRRSLPLAAGAIGLVLAAPLAGVLGLALGVAALLVLARALRPYPWRRAAVAVAAVAVVAAGTVAMRSETLTDFLRFLSTDEQTQDIESYSQRTLLLYIGGRIFLDHPVVGVGLRGSEEPAAFEPYLADARARFPDASPLAFPSPERRYGVQSLYVQSLADLGLVGAALLVALLAATLALTRRNAAGVLGVAWLLLCVGLWGAQGLVAGLPLGALTWIAVGLLASGAAQEARA